MKLHKKGEKKSCSLKTKSLKLTTKTIQIWAVSVVKVSLSSILKVHTKIISKGKGKRIFDWGRNLNFLTLIFLILVLQIKDWQIGLLKVWKATVLTKGEITSPRGWRRTTWNKKVELRKIYWERKSFHRSRTEWIEDRISRS